MGGKCQGCGKILFPPRPICDNCFSNQFDWVEISINGKLLTYTVIHVAPVQFQSIAPYVVGVVQLDNELKIPGMIKNVTPEQLKIGMALSIVFEQACATPGQWPQWPRYHFKPL